MNNLSFLNSFLIADSALSFLPLFPPAHVFSFNKTVLEIGDMEVIKNKQMNNNSNNNKPVPTLLELIDLNT